MAKSKVLNPVFKFWVENKIANERKYFVSDIRTMFQKWLLTKEMEWLEYYNVELVIASFITGKDGLNSTYENSQFLELTRYLTPDYKRIISGINPVTRQPMT